VKWVYEIFHRATVARFDVPEKNLLPYQMPFVLPKELMEMLQDYLHSDIVRTSEGLVLELRPCKMFEIRTNKNGTTSVWPCVTQ